MKVGAQRDRAAAALGEDTEADKPHVHEVAQRNADGARSCQRHIELHRQRVAAADAHGEAGDSQAAVGELRAVDGAMVALVAAEGVVGQRCVPQHSQLLVNQRLWGVNGSGNRG